MNKPASIDGFAVALSTSLDEETARLVRELAARRGQTAEQFAVEAIRRVAESEADFDAFLQKGIDEADRGDLVEHEEVMAELDAMIAEQEARCRS